MAAKPDALVPWVQGRSVARCEVECRHKRASANATTQSEQGRIQAKAAGMRGIESGCPCKEGEAALQ